MTTPIGYTYFHTNCYILHHNYAESAFNTRALAHDEPAVCTTERDTTAEKDVKEMKELASISQKALRFIMVLVASSVSSYDNVLYLRSK